MVPMKIEMVSDKGQTVPQIIVEMIPNESPIVPVTCPEKSKMLSVKSQMVLETNKINNESTSKLFQVAELAGFLQLQGSDLVFNVDTNGRLVYYDCILSCRWTDYGMISYLALMDEQTNIVRIDHFKLPKDKLNGLRRLPVSDLTVAALSFDIWKDLHNKKVLILVSDWLQTDKICDLSVTNDIQSGHFRRLDSMDSLRKRAKKYHISFHIESFQLMDSNESVQKTNRRSPIMLRLMMCNELIAKFVSPKQLDESAEQFYDNGFLPKFLTKCKLLDFIRKKAAFILEPQLKNDV